MSAEDKVVDNEATRRLMKSMKVDGDAEVYPRWRTEKTFQVFWILASLGIFYFNTEVALKQFPDFYVDVVVFVQGALFLKGWNFIGPFMDLAEEVGLVYDDTLSSEEQS